MYCARTFKILIFWYPYNHRQKVGPKPLGGVTTHYQYNYALVYSVDGAKQTNSTSLEMFKIFVISSIWLGGPRVGESFCGGVSHLIHLWMEPKKTVTLGWLRIVGATMFSPLKGWGVITLSSNPTVFYVYVHEEAFVKG